MADHNHASADSAGVGEQIGGYRLVERLGDGSTSTVFLGEHVKLGRRAAIKVLSSDSSDDPRTVERLLHEARVVNDIRHPNIVDIFDFVEQADPRRVALVMEYIEGPSLKTFRGDPLPSSDALALALQLVDAVQAAHSRGVVHRDLKPDNLLLNVAPDRAGDRSLSIKVVDFGIAKSAGPHAQAMTVTGTLLGTPAYMAPEQIAGSPAPSSATDVFALGAVVYEMLSGARAYPSPRLSETVRMKLRGELPELTPPPIPDGARLVDLVVGCLARNPTDRPRLDEVRTALDGFLRSAAGEHHTDALKLPTLGLTSASLASVPAAATELSEVPMSAVYAARETSEAHAVDALPELMAMLEAQELPDDEDEVGTELARPSVDMPALDAATEQASANPPSWAMSQREVATAQSTTGIPDASSSPTNRVLEALTDEVSEPPETQLSAEAMDPTAEVGAAADPAGLLGPAGVPSLGVERDQATATFPGALARQAAPADTKPPPGVAPPDPVLARGTAGRAEVRPDQVFASGVGLAIDAPAESSSPSRPSVATAPPPPKGRGVLAALLVLLAAALVVGVAVLAGVVDVPTDEEPAPVHRAPAPAKPAAAPAVSP